MKKTLWIVGLMIMAVIILSPENVQAKTIKKTKYFDLNEANNKYTYLAGLDHAKKIKIKSSNPTVLTVKYKNHKEVGKCIYYKAKKAGTAKITISYTTNGKKKKYIYSYHVIEKGKTVKKLGKQAFKIQNQYRRNKGAERLQWSDELYQFALYRAKKHGMDLHKFLEEDTQTYFGDFVSKNHFAFGENLNLCGPSAKESMEDWKNSKAHYKNLLKSQYKSGAIVYYNGSWSAIFSYKDASFFENWEQKQDKLKTVVVKRVDSQTGQAISGSTIQYYEKGDRWNTTVTKTINYNKGATLYLKKGITYIISERTAPDGIEKAQSIEVLISEDSDEEIVLQ